MDFDSDQPWNNVSMLEASSDCFADCYPLSSDSLVCSRLTCRPAYVEIVSRLLRRFVRFRREWNRTDDVSVWSCRSALRFGRSKHLVVGERKGSRERDKPCRIERSNFEVHCRSLRCRDHRRRLSELRLDHGDGRISDRHVCFEWCELLDHRPERWHRIESEKEEKEIFTLSGDDGSSKRTKPKPFDRPDLSYFTVALSTVPKFEK